MPLMNTAFRPGSALPAVNAMKEGAQRDIAMAEYHYFSGQPEKAAMEAEAYLDSEGMGSRLSAYLIYTYANLSLGRIQKAREGLDAINAFLFAAGKQSPELRTAAAFIASAGPDRGLRRAPWPPWRHAGGSHKTWMAGRF